MKLKSFLSLFDFFEYDEFGNYSIKWKKFILATVLCFIIFVVIATVVLSAFHNIFPYETTYMSKMPYNDTYYNISFNASKEHFSNNFIKGVYLSSEELNYNHTQLPLDKNHNLHYSVKVPKNITNFTLDLYFDADFPFSPEHIILNVTKI